MAIAIVLLRTSGALGQPANYVLDNGLTAGYWEPQPYPLEPIWIPTSVLNASDTTEPRDNWFANEFTAQEGNNLITRVDFYSFTTTPGSVADVVLYQVTGAGGNPALGATRVYTQPFTPPHGDGGGVWVTQIQLSTPIVFTVGSKFLVAIFIPDVIAMQPYDVYPYVYDTSGNATGSYWDRSNPNAFNLDNISGAMPVDQNLADSDWNPGANHLFIRAYGVPKVLIATPPGNQMVLVGQNATFSVTAWSPREAPLYYQWRFNYTDIVGATASSYTRTNAQPADAGLYDVVVTNVYGSVASAVATLTVVIDIGVRMFDGTSIVGIACEAPATGGSLVSPLRMAKNGTNYGVVLVETNSPFASKLRVVTSSGPKAWAKLP